MGSIANNKHIVVHAVPGGWGHNKPLCAFVVHILEEQPEVVITYFTAFAIYSRIMGEFKRLEPVRFAAIEPRLNIMDIAGPDYDVMKPLLTFGPNFAAIYSSGSVTCLTTGKTINGLPAPTLAIIDPFAAYAIEPIRAIAGNSLPILSWWTATAGSLYRLFGPAELGGVADPALETAQGRAVAKKKLLAREQIEWHECVGKVVKIAGIEPSYDYEWFPQKTPMLPIAAFLEKMGSIYVRETDGIVCVAANAFEPEAGKALKEWYTSMNKACYFVGPLSIHVPGIQGSKFVQKENESDTLVVAFLNRIQKEFGDKSLIYMSFGTVFWPEESDRVWAVIDGFIEKRQPFLFSHPSPFHQFPDEMAQKIKASGIAMELRWSPQELILTHSATGWFITHGGWNSMQEAFMHRVPLIFWPFHADQPYNAMRMLNMKAGFELIEVRTGPVGSRIPYRCKETPAFTPASSKAEVMNLIEKLKGDEGSFVRMNFEAVADAVGRAWDTPEGDSKKDLLALLKKYV